MGVFGVLLNLVLPEIVIIAFLAILLSYNAYKTLSKGVEKFRAETKKAEAAGKAIPVPPAVGVVTDAKSPKSEEDALEIKKQISKNSVGSVKSDTSFKSEHTEFAKEPIGKDEFHIALDGARKDANAKADREREAEATETKPDDAPSEMLQKILAQDSVQFPVWAYAMLLPMTAYTIVYAIVKKFYLSTCQPAAYWTWYFSPVLVLGGFMIVVAVLLKRRHQRKVEAGYLFKGDGELNPAYREMKWDDATLKKFPLIAVLAGVAAGLLGIGGGMVIGPLFIGLDMQPKVGSSSCAFMILWTAISGVVQYSFAGKLGWQFILYGIAVGFISGQMGQLIVDKMLRKFNRPSLVIFLLGGIVLVACISMTISGIVKVIFAVSDGADLFNFDTASFECQ